MDKFENYCEKYGFVADNAKDEFKQIINHNRFKMLRIDIYMINPYMLFLRGIEKNVSVAFENGRVIIRKKDKNNTSIVDILFDKISNCIIKKYSDMQYEMIFTIHNIYYKLLVVI